MPQFLPDVTKRAIVPITITPSGLSVESEVWMGTHEGVKMASSGRIPFTSTGSQQNISHAIVMPGPPDFYQVFIDVYAAGVLILAYVATEDVQIVYPVMSYSSVLATAFLTEQQQIGGGLPSVRVTKVGMAPLVQDFSLWLVEMSVKNFTGQAATKEVKFGRGFDPAWIGFGDKGFYVTTLNLAPEGSATVRFFLRTMMPGMYSIMSDFQVIEFVTQVGQAPSTWVGDGRAVYLEGRAMGYPEINIG